MLIVSFLKLWNGKRCDEYSKGRFTCLFLNLIKNIEYSFSIFTFVKFWVKCVEVLGIKFILYNAQCFAETGGLK